MSANLDNNFDFSNDSWENSTSGSNENLPSKNIRTFEYNGNQISFDLSGDLMVNATEMAKVFGKRTSNFLSTDYAKRYIQSLCEARKTVSSELVKVTYGNNGGTWMNFNLALEFARWLNTDFGVWCNDRIIELKTFGFTATEDKIEELVENPDLVISLCMKLKEVRKQAEEARRLAAMQEQRALYFQKVTEEQKPKADYYDVIIERGCNTNVRDTAKELGFRQTDFVNMMLEWGILYRDRRGKLKPSSDAKNNDYCTLKEFHNEGYSGNQVLFTVKGKNYILQRLKGRGRMLPLL